MKHSFYRFRPDATNFNNFPAVPTCLFTLWSDAAGFFVSMIEYPSQAELKERFHYDPKTGLFYRLYFRGILRDIPKVTGSLDKNGYVTMTIGGNSFKGHILAWIFVYGEKPKMGIDHIDRNRANNAISNLRLATLSQNLYNQGIKKNNKSGYKGVFFSIESGKWKTQIRVNKKRYSAGVFDDPKTAHDAVCKLREKLHGEFVCHS